MSAEALRELLDGQLVVAGLEEPGADVDVVDARRAGQKLDDLVARAKLASLGVEPEKLTEEQISYQQSWR